MKMTVVIVKHPNDSGKYMFQVPDGHSLNAGELVLCNTKRGNGEIGVCATDSFTLGAPELICSMWGCNPRTIQPVIGRLAPEMWLRAAEKIRDEKLADDDFYHDDVAAIMQKP